MVWLQRALTSTGKLNNPWYSTAFPGTYAGISDTVTRVARYLGVVRPVVVTLRLSLILNKYGKYTKQLCAYMKMCILYYNVSMCHLPIKAIHFGKSLLAGGEINSITYIVCEISLVDYK